mmetsp:Transcript_94456/g.225051  ORF Transcript_94456/g.225051 Transcript_94456/m.225051 type:complete len:373 (+) Transcript_94456:1056-2174(+)
MEGPRRFQPALPGVLRAVAAESTLDRPQNGLHHVEGHTQRLGQDGQRPQSFLGHLPQRPHDVVYEEVGQKDLIHRPAHEHRHQHGRRQDGTTHVHEEVPHKLLQDQRPAGGRPSGDTRGRERHHERLARTHHQARQDDLEAVLPSCPQQGAGQLVHTHLDLPCAQHVHSAAQEQAQHAYRLAGPLAFHRAQGLGARLQAAAQLTQRPIRLVDLVAHLLHRDVERDGVLTGVKVFRGEEAVLLAIHGHSDLVVVDDVHLVEHRLLLPRHPFPLLHLSQQAPVDPLRLHLQVLRHLHQLHQAVLCQVLVQGMQSPLQIPRLAAVARLAAAAEDRHKLLLLLRLVVAAPSRRLVHHQRVAWQLLLFCYLHQLSLS